MKMKKNKIQKKVKKINVDLINQKRWAVEGEYRAKRDAIYQEYRAKRDALDKEYQPKRDALYIKYFTLYERISTEDKGE